MTAVPAPSDERLVRMAARALGRHGLVHAYGHCSMRLDEGHFLVCAPVPMGQMPPEATGSVVPIEGPMPEGVLGEVRIHREIYRRRPEVGDKFDPQHHEAMSMVPAPDAEPNSVVAVVQKGYLLNGRVVRPAMVVVAKAEDAPKIDEQA